MPHTLTRTLLAAAILSSAAPALAAQVGQTAIGTTNYPNGGLTFIGDAPFPATNTRGQYSSALDSATNTMLYGSIHGDLTKFQLGDGAADPTFIGATTSLADGFPGRNGATIGSLTNMVMDDRSPDLSQHYAYVGGNTPTGTGANSYVMKVQLFPGGDLNAAPKVVSVLTLPIANTIAGSAIDLVNGYAYYTGFQSGTLVQINLNDNSIKSVTGLPSTLNYWQMGLSGNSLFISDNSQIQRVTLGPNGALPASLNSSNLTSLTTSAPFASFYVDPDPSHPYAYTATNSYVVGSSLTNQPSTVTRINISGPTMTEGPSRSLSLPDTSLYASLGAIDPDSHALLMGTDNALPGSISKISGETASGPTLLGSIDLPSYSATQPPPYTSGDLNLRDAAIDPKTGYAYFGTDAVANHAIKVQYSQKGSIKGNKITLPAHASLTSVNFYANLPAPPTASSTGNIRLALYADASGSPGALLWQSADIADTVNPTGGWLSVTTGLPTLTLAGDYWLAWQIDSTLDIPGYTLASPSTGFTFNQPFSSFPTTLPTPANGLTPTSDLWSMNLQFTQVPEPTTLALLTLASPLLLRRRKLFPQALSLKPTPSSHSHTATPDTSP